MISLQKTSGLPIELTDDFYLKFNLPLKDFPVTIGRKFAEIRPLLLDQTAKAEADVLYNVYRGIHLPQDAEKIKAHHLTYDITILPPVMLGKEYNKTVGHYHANIPGLQVAHPELYEVLHGQGLFILQKMDEAFEKLLDVIVVSAKAGDKIIYPPNYGHNFVNTGPEPLVTANWISTDYKPLYEPIADRHGMAYYVVSDEEEKYRFVKNPNYQNHPQVRALEHIKVVQELGFSTEEPMYVTGMKNPVKLEFLNYPEKYLAQLNKLV